ncbi:MAG TPA: TonB-dependent receptor [Patescibacteria group bacterium]|nr:TonB-dependent receptor [Patescibacteria group bacterium]
MRGGRTRFVGIFLGLIIGHWGDSALAQEPETSQEVVPLPEILVTAPARLPEVPLSMAEIPASVQVITGEEIARSKAGTLQEFMQRLPGVHLNDQQGNSQQFDLSFRGFTGSSVTGIPQGISVFVDGVRVNEPAVEEINFDLLPLDHVERIELIRGPMAVFGRNSLAGSVNIITRRGGPEREIEAEMSGGSYGRRKAGGHISGTAGLIDYYFAGSQFDEDGWREQTDSRLSQAFGKLGFRHGGTDITFSYQFQNNRILQAGTLPESVLKVDRAQNFTGGDFFNPNLHMGTLNVHQRLGGGFSLALNGFVRSLETEQFNVSLLSENSRLFNDTFSGGGTIQLAHEGRFWGRKNSLTLGVEGARHDVDIRVFEEQNDRSRRRCRDEALAAGQDPDDACPEQALASVLSDKQDTVGAYIQDTAELGRGLLLSDDSLFVTGALRVDYVRHNITDSSPEEPGKASGRASFSRALPRAGINYNLSDHYGLYFSYSQGYRVPAFLELTCADPDSPCVGLQAGVAPDTGFFKLSPVRTHNYEVGFRARPLPWLEGNVALYRSDVRDDIFSVSDPAELTVFFQNVGNTRRQGVEIGLRGIFRNLLETYVNYTLTRATFRDSIRLASPRTPGMPQQVNAGDDIPMTPSHRVNVGLRYHLYQWLSLSLDLSYIGDQFLRGDEANTQAKLDDYVILNAGLDLHWKQFNGFVKINNLTDNRYETFGTFAPNAKVAGEPIERFLNPAPPINVLVGASYRF